MNTEQKYHLITRNLQEILVDEVVLKKIIDARPLRIYWGTSCYRENSTSAIWFKC